MAAVTSSVDTETSARVFDPNFCNNKWIAFAFKDSILLLLSEKTNSRKCPFLKSKMRRSRIFSCYLRRLEKDLFLLSSIQKVFLANLKRNNEFEYFLKWPFWNSHFIASLSLNTVVESEKKFAVETFKYPGQPFLK